MESPTRISAALNVEKYDMDVAYILTYIIDKNMAAMPHWRTAHVHSMKHSSEFADHLVDVLPDDARILRSVIDGPSSNYLLEGPAWAAHIRSFQGAAEINLVATQMMFAKEITDFLVDRLRVPGEPSERTVAFFTWTAEESHPERKVVPAAPWSDVAVNYSTKTRSALKELAAFEEIPEGGGRIILFHGKPGTGKTRALRMLITEWQEWASIELISDPESLLEKASYMTSVLLNNVNNRPTRVLILEDADYLVEYQGTRSSSVARLLQLGDGLLGSSQQIIFLITTNKPPRELDSALTRPGRCLASICFTSFSKAEASSRLAGTTKKATGPMTLAEIYRAMGDARQITAGEDDSAPRGQYL
jgi:Domain of unknown function (DUF5925)/ATPase family associated with various cellular activities (AAA)